MILKGLLIVWYSAKNVMWPYGPLQRQMLNYKAQLKTFISSRFWGSGGQRLSQTQLKAELDQLD